MDQYNRRKFLTLIGLGTIGLTGVALTLKNILKTETEKQPLLFLGHGSPMNAIESNQFSESWKQIGKNLSPKAIVVVSAHWETSGTQVFSGSKNKIIYDFYGFPQELYSVQYSAPSNSQLAKSIAQKNSTIALSEAWGLDHGAWSVLVNAFPKGDIPVIQLSLNKNLSIKDHFELAKELKFLRDQGVLVIGSGNIVHNLRVLQWSNPAPYDWANDIQSKILDIVKNHDYEKLVELSKDSNFIKAHPTIEHYLPLIYTFGLADKNEEIITFTPTVEMGSISMASFLIKSL